MTTTASASDAITASFSPAAGLLSVDGDNANNEIVISRDAAGLLLINGGAVQIVGGVPTVANTSLIQMFGQGGNDTLTLDEASGALPAAEMFGGNGNDTLTGGAGGDRLFGENGNDTLLGKGGLDQLFGGDGNDTIDGNRGDDKSRMGAGDDTFIWDPGDGSDDVDGEDGSDKLLFNGANVAENIDVSARGNGRVRFFRDVASITMDLGTVEKIEFNALGGVDNIVVNDLQRGDTVELALSLEAQVGGVVGDGLADTVTVNGTNQADNVEVAGSETSYTVTGLPALVRVVGSEATDQLVLDVARGDDRVNAAALAAGVVKLTVDGGAGDDTIFGSRGADAFVGGSGDDTIDGNQADDVAHMGGGRDTFIWDPGDGSDTVEGQGGQDTLRFNGAGASENIDIAANGQRVRFFRDVANITMDLYEVQRIEFNALGGADNIVVNDLSGTDARDIKLDLAAVAGGGAGDGQADTVTVTGTNERDTVNISRPSGVVVRGLRADVEILGSEAANDQLKVNVLGGDDRVDADNLPAGSFVLLTMDGGDGTDRLIGSQGQDAAVNGEILVNIP